MSFIETSALDANNVEAAFQNILTGLFSSRNPLVGESGKADYWLNPEIYHIVSSKALESSNDVVRPAGGENITIAPSSDDGGAKKANCC